MEFYPKTVFAGMYKRYKEKQNSNHSTVRNAKLYEEALKYLANDNVTPVNMPFKQYYSLQTANIIDNLEEVFDTFEHIIQYMDKTDDICSLLEGLNRSKHLEYQTSYYAIKVQTLADVVLKLIHHIYRFNNTESSPQKIIKKLQEFNDSFSLTIVNELKKLKEFNDEIRTFRNEYAHENNFLDTSLTLMKLMETNPGNFDNELDFNTFLSTDITFRVSEIKNRTETIYQIVRTILDSLYPMYKEIMEGKRKGQKEYVPQDFHVSKGFKINVLEQK